MNILAIGAHPDDVEFGCCGYLINRKKAGDRIFVAIMTDGDAGESAASERRIQEAEAVACLIDFDLIRLSFTDGDIPVNSRSIRKVCELIAQTKPNIILTHSAHDLHQDHRNTNEIVLAAARTQTVLLFRAFSESGFLPTAFSAYDVRDKKNALNVHKSQIQKYNGRGIDFIEKALAADKYYGEIINRPYAEGFEVAKWII